MATKTEICNMALSALGASTITSLEDGTREADLCLTLFDELARRVMCQGPWTSTLKRATLARTTNTPLFEFANEFQLPVDPRCLVVLGTSDCNLTTLYKREGDKILTDVDTMKIKYIAEITDPGEYGTLLTECIELLLTSHLAKTLAGDKETAAMLKQEYGQVLRNNLAIDNQQGSKDMIITDDFTSVR